MSLELRCAATTIGRLLPSGPQSDVLVALTGSLLAANAGDLFPRLRQTDESLGNELSATRY